MVFGGRERRAAWPLATLCGALLAAGAVAADPEGDRAELREQLFAAAADVDELSALAERHRDAIRASYPAWLRRHAALQGEARARSERGLEALASTFERHGDRTLRGLLSGIAATHRARGWGRILHEARERARGGDCATAVARLEPLAAELDGWQGEAADAIALGAGDVLGSCHLLAGAFERALAVTYRAYERAVESGDRESVIAFGRRMAAAHAGAGESSRAREWAGATAGVLRTEGQDGEARALERAYGMPGAE